MTSLQSILSPLFAVFLAVGLLSVGGCGSGTGGDDLRVVEPRLVKTQNGTRSFTGTLVNDGSAAVAVVQIEVALYDDEGSSVETIQIEVDDVPARDSLDFKSRIDSDQAFTQAQVQRVLAP